MKYNTINLIFFSLIFALSLSCKNQNDSNSNLKKHFESLNLNLKKTSISIIDPNYCGSCTSYTIHWLNIHRDSNVYEKYYILSTDSIPKNLLDSLNQNKYVIKIINGEKLKRQGLNGAVSYNIIFENKNFKARRIIKEK